MSFWKNLFATIGLGLLVIPGLIWSWIFHFRLIERQNQHFSRQQRFYGLIADTFSKRASESNNQEMRVIAEQMRALINEAAKEEPKRHPWIWGVILPALLLGIPMFYTYWFLMKDLLKHSLRQIKMTEIVSQGLQTIIDENVSIPDQSAVPNRFYWIYLLLSPLLFISIFVLVYRIFDDCNKHFIEQRHTEDRILVYLNKVFSTT